MSQVRRRARRACSRPRRAGWVPQVQDPADLLAGDARCRTRCRPSARAGWRRRAPGPRCPTSRKISMVRWLVMCARGVFAVQRYLVIMMLSTPRVDRNSAAEAPAGPDPTIRTSVVTTMSSGSRSRRVPSSNRAIAHTTFVPYISPSGSLISSSRAPSGSRKYSEAPLDVLVVDAGGVEPVLRGGPVLGRHRDRAGGAGRRAPRRTGRGRARAGRRRRGVAVADVEEEVRRAGVVAVLEHVGQREAEHALVELDRPLARRC